jgi:hypothetical protein
MLERWNRSARGANQQVTRRAQEEAEDEHHKQTKACGTMLLLTEDPAIRPTSHIFVGSKAPWFTITDAPPQHDQHMAKV